LQAQACGNLTQEDADAALYHLGAIFYDPENAETRDTIIQQLDSATHPGAIVRDDAVCQAVVARMVEARRQGNLRWQGEQTPAFTSAVFRFGPYYVGIIREIISPQPGALGGAFARGGQMIFRVSDLEFLLSVF
jgi:hypothetical protein